MQEADLLGGWWRPDPALVLVEYDDGEESRGKPLR